jgi:hypothetical protein
LGESSCYSMVYSRLGEHARTGDCTLLDHAGRLLLECPEWSLLSVYISYASVSPLTVLDGICEYLYFR